MKTCKKDVLLNNFSTGWKDRKKAILKAGDLRRKYGVIFYVKRVTVKKTYCKKNIVKTEYPERFFLC